MSERCKTGEFLAGRQPDASLRMEGFKRLAYGEKSNGLKTCVEDKDDGGARVSVYVKGGNADSVP